MTLDRRHFMTSAAAGGVTLFGGGLVAHAQEAAAESAVIPEMVKGAADAPIEVIEYASFTCPHCRSFHEQLWPQIEADYVETGLVRFVYREVYFDRPGLWASMVARCGGEEKFFGIVDLIFSGQQQVFSGDGPEIAQNLRRLGLLAGIDAEELDACMTDGEWAQDLMGWYSTNRDTDGVNSTPTFLINGVKLESSWTSGLMPALEAAVQELG